MTYLSKEEITRYRNAPFLFQPPSFFSHTAFVRSFVVHCGANLLGKMDTIGMHCEVRWQYGARREEAMAGIETLIATKDTGDRTLYCFLAGRLRLEPEYAPFGYDRIQLYLNVRTENDANADAASTIIADVTLTQGDSSDDHVRIIDFVTRKEDLGCGTFVLEVLCLIADYYGCRGIMGELFEDDLTRNKEKTFAFFGKRGFEVLCQEDNKVHPYRVQTTTYRDRLPEGIVLSLTGLES